MSVRFWNDCECAVCKHKNLFLDLASTSFFRNCDLDLRPLEPGRINTEILLRECLGCGYVALDLGQRTEGDVETMALLEYQGLVPLEKLRPPKLFDYDAPAVVYIRRLRSYLRRTDLSRHLRHAMLMERAGDLSAACQTMQWLGWWGDDYKRPDIARLARTRMLAYAEKWLQSARQPNPGQLAGVHLAMIDAARRSEDWDKGLSLCEKITAFALEPLDLRVVEQQKRLLSQRDSHCYTICLDEPEEV